MGFTSVWALTTHEDSTIEELLPRFLPVIEAERTDRHNVRRWAAWQQAPLPDHDTWHEYDHDDGIVGFLRMTAASTRMTGACIADDFWILTDVWERQPDSGAGYMSVHSKDYAVSAFFHGIGPQRAALLPGWCGNAVLTSVEVRHALPRVESALGFTPRQRAAARDRTWLDTENEESLLEGPLRVWRHAAAEGHGLCMVSTLVD